MTERILRDALVFRDDADGRPFMDAAYPWLEAGDSLLRAPVGKEKPFYPLRDWAGNGFAQLSFYALQYHNAARDLVERWLHSRGPAESSVFAIAFAYRQAIELYLKSFIVSYTPGFAQMSIKKRRKLLAPRGSGHDLKRLWKTVLKHIPAEAIDSELENITRVLGEFAGIDERADGFRYPFRISGEEESLIIEELAIPLEGKSADNFIWCLEALTNAIAMIPDGIERYGEYMDDMAAGACL